MCVSVRACMLMCMHTRGGWRTTLVLCSGALHILWDGISRWFGTHQLSQTGYLPVYSPRKIEFQVYAFMPSFYEGTVLKSDPYSCKTNTIWSYQKTHHSLLGLLFINYFEVAICLAIWTKQSNGLRYGPIYLCKYFYKPPLGAHLPLG